MKKKSFLAKLIFKILVKGMNGANLYDSRVKADVKSLPSNFTVSLGVFPCGEYITFSVDENHIKSVKDVSNPDLEITFKNNKIATKVLLGKMSIAQAFSNHALILKGDIYKSLALVRIINVVENYLFPKWYTKAIPNIKREVSMLKMYMYVLFGSKNKKVKARG